MAVVKNKPTSPGKRFVMNVSRPELHKGQPFASLVEKQKRGSGRNNAGRITTRHRGGGHAHKYRITPAETMASAMSMARSRNSMVSTWTDSPRAVMAVAVALES